ncbi:hypothetical protein SORBI_3001G235200 [Sorghum bicolor]|nr:hypothetical protein SORBI_3001G235200 [Sorghum bicolor]
MENYRAREEDVDVWILRLLEEGSVDAANLNDCCLSGDLPAPSPSPDANDNGHVGIYRIDAELLNFNYLTGPRKSGPRGTRKRRTSPWQDNVPRGPSERSSRCHDRSIATGNKVRWWLVY